MSNDLRGQYVQNVQPGPDYDDGSSPPPLPDRKPVRLIAYYLPQFHAIPENDEWWGKGFTEWTNATKALPGFEGHYQPRLPGALGFYDLRDPDALRRQAELARRYGIEGFCFHHYWFGGRRLLETPINNLLANPDIDLPFCVNWANENWSRRWDGSESAILMAQQHSPEDDLAFARSLEPLFDDPRYIRIGGRPLLMLYRPGLLPDAAATVQRWRDHFAARGDDPYIVMAQVFEDYDPRPYGMDGAAGFAPGPARTRVDPIFPAKLFDPSYRGHVLPYDEVALEVLAHRSTEYRAFPGVCPSWDNEARRPGVGLVVHGSTPAKYGAWLEAAGRQAIESAPEDERIVFINAWNEWAEGTYLEPDRHFGFAYLAETARVLARIAERPNLPADTSPFRTADALAPTPAYLRLVRRAARKGARIAEGIARSLSSF